MHCKTCGSKWESSVEIEKCPFCGANLKEEENTPTEFADIPSVIAYLVDKQSEDILLHPDIVISYVMDLVPKKERDKKLFRIGCNYGVLKKVHEILAEPKQNRQEILMLNLKQNLIDNAFLTEESANEIIQISLQGVGLLLPISLSQTQVLLSDQMQKKTAEQLNSDNFGAEITPGSTPNICEKNMLIQCKPAVYAGDNYTIGLKADGTVKTIGNHYFGKAQVSDWKDIVSISADYWNTAGLKADGTVIVVGNNQYGQCDVLHWKDIISVSCGWKHTVGLKSDGTVVAVGDNENGQCNVSDWKDIISISAGYLHTAGLKSDGTVIAVGGLIDQQWELSKWKNIIAIASGNGFIVGVKSNGTVISEGDCPNSYGLERWYDIMDISASTQTVIALKKYGTVEAIGRNLSNQCDVEKWNDIVSISAGTWHTVGLKSDGTVVTTSDKDRDEISKWNLIK